MQTYKYIPNKERGHIYDNLQSSFPVTSHEIIAGIYNYFLPLPNLCLYQAPHQVQR